MKITRLFKYHLAKHTNGDYESGWVLAAKPHFDPVMHDRGRSHVLIHDIMEHQNSDGDSVAYEFLALGATYFIRVEGQWDRFKTGFHGDNEVMAMDCAHFYTLVKGKIPKCHRPEPVSEVMEARLNTLREYYQKHDYDPAFMEALPDICAWLNKGYNRAARRWNGHTSAEVMALWNKLHDTLQNADLRSLDNCVCTTKHTMAVQFDTQALTFVIRWFKDRKVMLKLSG